MHTGAHNEKECATLDTGNGTTFDQTTVPSMSIYGDQVIITKEVFTTEDQQLNAWEVRYSVRLHMAYMNIIITTWDCDHIISHIWTCSDVLGQTLSYMLHAPSRYGFLMHSIQPL